MKNKTIYMLLVLLVSVTALSIFRNSSMLAMYNRSAGSQSDLTLEVRKKIVMIDTGISRAQMKGEYACRDYQHDFTHDEDGIDRVGHGTNVFGLISDTINPKTHCIASYKVTSAGHGEQSVIYNTVNAIYKAIRIGAVSINISMSGKDSQSESEYRAMSMALDNEIKIVVAAGNDSAELSKYNCNVYPACYKLRFLQEKHKKVKNYFVVGCSSIPFSNKGEVIDLFENRCSRVGSPSMSGTSQAAGVFTGKLIYVKNL